MTLTHLNKALRSEIDIITAEGRAKQPERIITEYVPADGENGPRYMLQGNNMPFLRFNSNSYLSLSNHPSLIEAADQACRLCGVGPGAVRFIDGTYSYHVELEEKVAAFVDKPAAKIFNSAYTANCGLALTVSNRKTHWIGDQLNHNSIIRAMRIAGVPSQNKSIFKHNDMDDFIRCFSDVEEGIERVIVVFDGIFSMRGDYAPIHQIQEIADDFSIRYPDGVITIMDDSHGLGAYGENGRGTAEFCSVWPDIIVGTFGKAFGVNGGFIAASETVIEAVRQKADTYIYTNPLSVADCAAATKALEICDSGEGRGLLASLRQRTRQFRDGLDTLGLESIHGPHPVVPLMIRDTEKTKRLVKNLFEAGVLVVGLTFPVVPEGDESIRFQINSAHTEADIDYVLHVLKQNV